MGFKKGKLLNLRCAYHGCYLAHNRSILRNERPDTLDPGVKSIGSPSVQRQLPSFPFGCYTNPGMWRIHDSPEALRRVVAV
jgi:hypothetical protein